MSGHQDDAVFDACARIAKAQAREPREKKQERRVVAYLYPRTGEIIPLPLDRKKAAEPDDTRPAA